MVNFQALVDTWIPRVHDLTMGRKYRDRLSEQHQSAAAVCLGPHSPGGVRGPHRTDGGDAQRTADQDRQGDADEAHISNSLARLEGLNDDRGGRQPPAVSAESVEGEVRDIVGGVGEIGYILRDVYTKDGINIWLNARNSNFGGSSPVELIMRGDLDTVLREARRLARLM